MAGFGDGEGVGAEAREWPLGTGKGNWKLEEGIQDCIIVSHCEFTVSPCECSTVRPLSYFSIELKNNKFVLFEATEFVIICYSSNRKQIRCSEQGWVRRAGTGHLGVSVG